MGSLVHSGCGLSVLIVIDVERHRTLDLDVVSGIACHFFFANICGRSSSVVSQWSASMLAC